MTDLRVAEPCPLELHTRISKHVVIEVEAERAGGPGAEQFEDAPRASAEVDQQREWPVTQRLVHSHLNILLSDMQRADRIPFSGVCLEIGLRRFGARLLLRLGPGAVAGERQVLGINAVDD